MSNQISHVTLFDRLRDPTQPEVWIDVVPEHPSTTIDVRGRLEGPRCRYASTVEVAYPVRAYPGNESAAGSLQRRVIIPEASLWEPASPFLYRGPIELWDDGVLCDQLTLTHGLRYFTLNRNGLRLNGRPTALRGFVEVDTSEARLLHRRQEGYNLVLTDAQTAPESLWTLADEIGFLVLGRVPATVEAIERACARQPHASNLGWILAAEIFSEPGLRRAATSLLKRTAGELIGIEAPTDVVPPEVQFVLGPSADLPHLLPASDDAPPAPGLLGTVQP